MKFDAVAKWFIKGNRLSWFLYISVGLYVALVLSGGFYFQRSVRAAHGETKSCECVCRP